MGIRRSLTKRLSLGLGILIPRKNGSPDELSERQLGKLKPIVKKDNNKTSNSIEDEVTLGTNPKIGEPISSAFEKRNEIKDKSGRGTTSHGKSEGREENSPRTLIRTWRSLESGGPEYNEIEMVSRWSTSSNATYMSGKAGSMQNKATGLGITGWRIQKANEPDCNKIGAESRDRKDSEASDWRERARYAADLGRNREFFVGMPLGQCLDTEAERRAREDPLFERLMLEAQEPSSGRGSAAIRTFWEDVRSQLNTIDDNEELEELGWPEGCFDNREMTPDVIEQYLESRFAIPIDQEALQKREEGRPTSEAEGHKKHTKKP